jgi:hypothetical protein
LDLEVNSKAHQKDGVRLTFALNFFKGFSDEARNNYLQEVRRVLEPQLRDADGYWVADYVRLRFAATKARG